MVKSLKFLFIFALLLSLASCDFFNASIFPAYLPDLIHSVDVDWLFEGASSNPHDWDFFGVFATSGTQAYLSLLYYDDINPPHLEIFDLYLGNAASDSSPELGSFHMVDMNGNFVIGQLLWDTSSFTFQANCPQEGFGTRNDDITVNHIFDIGYTAPYELIIDEWSPDWLTLNPPSPMNIK